MKEALQIAAIVVNLVTLVLLVTICRNQQELRTLDAQRIEATKLTNLRLDELLKQVHRLNDEAAEDQP